MRDSSRLKALLVEYMDEHGMKNTRQRAVILETFLEVEGHVTIDELLARVQTRQSSVGYATVYRAIKLFRDAGVAHEHRFGDSPARYEPTVLDEHHDHLICTICGHIFEFEDEVIERRQQEVATRMGMRMTSHRMNLYGECMEPAECPHNEG